MKINEVYYGDNLEIIMANIKLNLPDNKIVKDYEKGYSLKKLSKKYFVDAKTIKSRLVSNGVLIRKKKTGRFKGEFINELINTKTVKEISKITRLSESTIYRYKKHLKKIVKI